MGGIPAADRDLLVLPPSGFLVDVSWPASAPVDPRGLAVRVRPWSGGESLDLGAPVVRRPDGATFAVPDGRALAPGSHTIWASAALPRGGSQSVGLAVAVREPHVPAPLAAGQWIQLDFDVDRDGDSLADFPTDLATFGLAGGRSVSLDMRVEAWVIDEIVARTQAFYDPNPSRLPGGDPLNVTFSADPPLSGPFTRICVAGEAPDDGDALGNVLLDPGNADPGDVACDDALPSGVFPRELTHYQEDPAYQRAFAPLLERPPGADPLDYAVLGGPYDPHSSAQRERLAELQAGVETFAQVVASIAAHEAGHAMGLVPPGAPGRGLYGGEIGVEYTHNLTAGGEVPAESLLMNPGPSFSFETLAGADDRSLPRMRALNFAYLQGRVLLDPTIDGIHPPPIVDAVSPDVISSDEGVMAVLEIAGRGFRSPPGVVLAGTTEVVVSRPAIVEGHGEVPDRIIGSVLAPALLPGRYDVQVRNPDGQTSTGRAMLEVR